MSHGGISTAVGALVEVLRAESDRVGVISYDDWRPKSGKTNSDAIEEGEDLWRVRTPEGARALITSKPFGEVARIVVHHPLLWDDGVTLSEHLDAPIDFVIHVDALHVAVVTNRELPEHYAALQARIIREATRVVALSRDVFNRWKASYPDASIHLAPLPLAKQNDIGTHRGSRDILSVGRFDFVKGTDILGETISAVLAQRPECQWTHIGGNPASPKTERRWKRKLETYLGERLLPQFTMLAWQDQAGLEVFYKRSSLVVVPSRYETFGLVAREAISYGVPVVAFDVGGLKDILLDDVTGRVVKEVDSDTLAHAILDAVDQLSSHPRLWSDSAVEQSEALESYARISWLRLYRNSEF